MLSSKLFNFKKYFLFSIKRHKMGRKHWEQSSKKTKASGFAMDYFDDFYGSVFGEKKWNIMKKAMLKEHKYIALVNNFGNNDETMKYLDSLGAYNMKKVFEAQKEFNKNSIKPLDSVKIENQVDLVSNFAKEISITEIESTYGNKETIILPEKIEIGNTTIGSDVKACTNDEDSTALSKSLFSSLEKPQYDESRIITPSAGMNNANLWTYIPTTRLKGCEDWLPESDHFKYYSSAKDFPLTIEDDGELNFPENLNVYSFLSDSKTRFPEPRRDTLDVYNYYLMDGASILPVLALDLKHGDRVLDLCAAPGGKSLAILQTLLSSMLITNDSSLSRVKRIKKVMSEYLYDFDTSNIWTERIQLSHEDGRVFGDKLDFNKILVDVPCTTDRISLNEDDNNIFKSTRLKERLHIPELQSELLSHALSLCKIGGTVVYSTCTLSPVQNDGVVHMGLKKAWEEHGVKATIKLLTKSFEPAISLFQFGKDRASPKYGQLVTPSIHSNFGPSYFAKMVRT